MTATKRLQPACSPLACLAAVILMVGALPASADAPGVPTYVAAAVADPARPDADRQRDAFRKPAGMMAFAGIKQGDTVIELIPGRGYFTRIISKSVGPSGRVFAAGIPDGVGDFKPAPTLAGDPNYPNVTATTMDKLLSLPPADIVWTSQNYHDLHLPKLKMDVVAFDRQVFAALKPGGAFVVIDHAALPGTGLDVPDQLHRINEDIVKQEVESAGFKLEAESDALRNPADPRTAKVFDSSIRGHTDQFVLLFRKPG